MTEQREAELARRAEPYAVAVVVRVDRPVSAHAGDRAVVTADGRLSGWVGGSCAEPVVVREALAALADRRPRLVRIRPASAATGPATDPGSDPGGDGALAAEEPGVVTELTTCASEGGLDVFVEPKLPAARLLIAGASPAARALTALAGALGEPVTTIVDQPHERVPGAAETLEVGALAGAALTEADAMVVATMNRYDEAALRAALATSAGYIGLIASRRRGRTTLALLAGEGVPAGELERITTPAGLDLGPSTQEEIALAVLAEIVVWRHRHAPAGMRTGAVPGGRPPAATAAGMTADSPVTTGAATAKETAEPRTAVDPVCGMRVAVTADAVTAEADGDRYWFCSPGCRDAFLAEPGRYLGSAAPGG